MASGTDPNDTSYLRYNGKPLVAARGVGFNDHRAYNLENCEWFLRLLKQNPEWGGCSIMVGAPLRLGALYDRDRYPDPRFTKFLKSADVISPWAVGRCREY